MLWKRLFVGFLLAVNLVFAWRLFLGEHGISAYLDLKERHRQMELDLEAAEHKSLEFSQEIRRLKSDRSHLEDVIRKRMNYLKENELLYVFSERSPGQPPAQLSGAGSHGDED